MATVQISRDEAKGAPRLASNFDAIDTNKDGQLSREELRSAWANRPHHHGPRMDFDGDGMISRDEAKGFADAVPVFRRDRRQQGWLLSRDEMVAWHRAQARGRRWPRSGARQALITT